MNCPHCGATENKCVADNVMFNAEAYGNNTFNLPCVSCGEMVCVSVVREVKVSRIVKSHVPKDLSDF